MPPVAAHPEEPFAPPDESSAPRYKRKPSKSGSIGILGAVTVGLLLAGVAYFAIQGKANDVQEKQDHHRAVELEQYHQLLLERLAFEKRWGNQDSETEAYNTVLETEMEYANIIAKYPKWGKSAMRH